jgi:glycosyltransferase involved in cell wall biosynthesis
MSPDRPLVLHLSTETGWRGGERQVQLLTDGLQQRGWRCLVACPPHSALYADREAGGLAVPFNPHGEFDLRAVGRLVALARRTGARLLHAHTSHAHTLAWLAAGVLNLPVVVTRRVDFPVGRNVLSLRKYLSPRVTFIAISRGVRDVLVAGGVAPSRIHVVHSGVDPARFPFRDGPRDEEAAHQLGVAADEVLILNVAALADHKDHATLVRAAARLRELTARRWKIVIAGTGELEAQVRQLIADHDLTERILLLGYVRDLAPLYRAADFFVLSSHLEGLCTSILDAMSAGVPVVATATGGVPEAVEDGVTGLLVPPRQPEDLARAMLAMLEHPQQRAAFARAARAKVEREFTADAMVEGTLAVYEKVLGAAP